MTVAETLLVYAGIPLAVVLVLALLTLRPGADRRPRYKPGQPWNHAPVWYEPHPAHVGGGHGPAPAHGPAAVPGSGTSALGSSMYPEQPGERALDSESGAGLALGDGAGGSHSRGATAARIAPPAGPLGGARGTW
ncbi:MULTISPECIES: aa3-type cytochrome oxidase subunit CtaJ [unclassified Blastococcus]